MDEKKAIIEHYDACASDYYRRYQKENMYDLSLKYPANYFRLQMMLGWMAEKNVKKVIEVGVGEGTPLVMMAKGGMDVWGFDISQGMVEMARENMRRNGLDPERIWLGDIEDLGTLQKAREDGPFDALIALGVMPHVKDDDGVLNNMKNLVRPGGVVYVEFRNKLFSLFTFNRFTLSFILDDLLSGVDEELKTLVRKDLEPRLRLDMPPLRTTIEGGNAPGYDAIRSKWHNPFEMVEKFSCLGFGNARLMWYHYHPAMPYLEPQAADLFRKEGIALEGKEPEWRGYFLCSAFVVEAKKK